MPLGILGALIGNITGWVVMGSITGLIVVSINGKGKDKNQIAQLGGGIGSLLGCVTGAMIGVRLTRNTDVEDTRQTMYYALGIAYLLNILDAATFEIDRKSISLQISPTYDVAQNGIGLGVSLRF